MSPVSAEQLNDIRNRVESFARDQMAEMEMPGVQIALTDRDGLIGAFNLGYANLDAQKPVTDETLFEFGSIGKSFTAICLLQLATEGKVEIDTPMAGQLPWFEVRSQYEPITVGHLLSHTSGLVSGTDFTPEQRYEVWSLRNTDTMWAPGTKFHYSNVGYKALGLLIEHVTGKPYGEVVRERIFEPLGMTGAVGAITHDMRHRLAVGYQETFDDRPRLLGHGVVPATWLETDSGDGCLCASASDLAIYLRMLINRGAYPGGRILTEEQFATLSTPRIVTSEEDDEAYGYGVSVSATRPPGPIGHSGGMVGYISDMRGDADTGYGALAFTNTMSGVWRITKYALELLNSASSGAEEPEPPVREESGFEGLAGRYVNASGAIQIDEDAGEFSLVRDGSRFPLRKTVWMDGNLVDDRPGENLFPWHALRNDDETIECIVHGPDVWVPEVADLPKTTDPELARLAGHYRANNPWQSNFRIVARGDSLYRVWAGGDEQKLTRIGDAWTGESDEDGPEQFWIDVFVDGLVGRVRDQLGSSWERSAAP